MEGLLDRIDAVRRGPVREIIEARLAEFQALRDAPPETLFKELCFCILTANTSADLCLRVCDEVGDAFLDASCSDEVTSLLKRARYRFYNVRGRHIAAARDVLATLKEIMKGFGTDEQGLRAWLADNIKGLGYKEASHFMRNIGYENVAIVDFHVVDILVKEGLVTRPKAMNKKVYATMEGVLQDVARRAGLSLAALDLYLWYLETGKVLK